MYLENCIHVSLKKIFSNVLDTNALSGSARAFADKRRDRKKDIDNIVIKQKVTNVSELRKSEIYSAATASHIQSAR